MFQRVASAAWVCLLGALAAGPGAIGAPPVRAGLTEPAADSAQKAAQPGLARFIWTNDEIDMLRANNVPISIVGPTGVAAGSAPTAPEELQSNVGAYDHSKDPQWYADRAAILRAELEARQTELDRQQQALAEARDERRSDPGIALDRGNAGITPSAGVENLESGVREVQEQFDALEDLARKNDIPLGVLRG